MALTTYYVIFVISNQITLKQHTMTLLTLATILAATLVLIIISLNDEINTARKDPSSKWYRVN